MPLLLGLYLTALFLLWCSLPDTPHKPFEVEEDFNGTHERS